MDQQVWAHIIEGDKEAYSDAYTEYYRKFYNYGKKFTVDEVLIEDSIQEVFLDIWKKRSSLTSVQSINSYLFSSFRYTLFARIRQAAKIVADEEIMEEPEFTAELAVIQKETDQELQKALQTAIEELTPRQREAIFLRFYEGLSYEEVAQVLNISVKATYKIMARSLSSLKNRMMLPLTVILALLKTLG